jgi:hypothetical protein
MRVVAFFLYLATSTAFALAALNAGGIIIVGASDAFYVCVVVALACYALARAVETW